MRAASEGFTSVASRSGSCIGIIPGEVVEGKYTTKADVYPNEFVELPIFTHLPSSGDQVCLLF